MSFDGVVTCDDSELGDKTFFVAALFAMKTSRAIAFIGAMGALVSMTAIAVSLGRLLSRIPIPTLNGIKVNSPHH
jgi:Ca2+/H+ antiporter, TMEM165/GDT1 family